MATEKASALRAFITGIVFVANRLGVAVQPLGANDQTRVPSRLLAWFCLAAPRWLRSWQSTRIGKTRPNMVFAAIL
jgi:hypothetical protein